MIQLTGENITIDEVWRVAYEFEKVELATSARENMQKSRDYIQGRIDNGDIMYGVNTGFGHFSNVSISNEQIVELQKNLIRSHCMGIGEPFSLEETRAIMFLRANALSRGHSGIRPIVAETILNYLNSNIIPVIPSQGSVGASGDLAPLSHLALAIIGEGKVWSDSGDQVSVTKLLKERSVEPLELQAKEGLSMINGCQVMTAIGLLNLYRGRRLMWLADLSGAMTLEALKGSRGAFDPLISATRPHPGEAKTARNIIKLMGETSPIAESHIDCGRVQDAYSLRCIPAVHGAAKDSFRHVQKVLETEANSSTDNPLVFAEDGKVLSCGNFHGEPVAYALDFAGIAMSGIANISECRIEKMINPSMSGLPAFLAPDGGLNSGHMIVQVAAASLVSENKILSHPASVDSIPTSADKEDHVSMGTIAARKFGKIVTNSERVIAMEMLSSCQALDMIKPLEPASAVKSVFNKIRETVPYATKDRVFSDDVEEIFHLIHDNKLTEVVDTTVGELEW
ncbi:MAG: histidine ammonia-lyase [Bdellovibrionales bacterium]|nr:histidine ammonia-lyase [Bdellovibrionales bacterium]NQZ18256.1 histidine ammonia-lyase [Bdellovibrionales bacterium]